MERGSDERGRCRAWRAAGRCGQGGGRRRYQYVGEIEMGGRLFAGSGLTERRVLRRRRARAGIGNVIDHGFRQAIGRRIVFGRIGKNL
ncbi:hypothetical protein GCM10007205_23950 [Oxalicibacterium flavum]|uniref:Uncharacterized protein n=1 Tax=Oxalicibacterium flavum TaxID=179467 RepID=A0A8J2UNL3_9BURK|nr:hypothetical protein GCM10007205_23950 [Oxalicibacterium flavum]